MRSELLLNTAYLIHPSRHNLSLIDYAVRRFREESLVSSYASNGRHDETVTSPRVWLPYMNN